MRSRFESVSALAYIIPPMPGSASTSAPPPPASARFLGMVPYERVPDYEAAADVFVTGSTSEVHPLVVIEAMAAGLPVVAVSSPCIAETIEDGVAGLLAEKVAPRRSRSAWGACRRCLRGCPATARTDAQRYSLENTADALLARFKELADTSQR